MCVRIAMAGWLHGVFVVDWLFVFPLCGFSLSLFCNYLKHVDAAVPAVSAFSVHARVLRANECCLNSLLMRYPVT